MPGHIPEDILDQIRSRADIVETVRTYVPTLKRAGTTWKACCPFHKEKTPSFTVNPALQSYKCFGCGKGGNVFTFLMEMEHLDFRSAVEMLAAKFGIVIPETHGRFRGEQQSKEAATANYNARERLFRLHELLAKWYAENLRLGKVPGVCEYFKTRAIPPEFASKFLIGAAPDSWDAGLLYAKKNGFTEQELRSSGIVSEKEDKPGHIYDRFRNRLVFPIWNEQGRVIAFSARTIESNPDGWKYVNSPESPVFKKSRTLYALHFARTAIAERQYVILCEGQLDTIAIHRAGCTNAVAAQGTAFGEEHAAILKRYTGEVRLALDNDKAGKKAVYADAAILLPMNFAVKVITWPGGKDADELMKTQGAQVIQDAVNSAVDFFEFALNDYSSENDVSTPAGKAKAAAFMLEKIQKMPEESAKDAYILWLAKRLGLTPDALKSDLAKLDNKAKQRFFYQGERDAERAEMNQPANAQATAPKEIPFSETSEGIRKAYLSIFQAILRDAELAKRATTEFDEDLCDEGAVSHAVDLCLQYTMQGHWSEASSKIITDFMQDNLPLETVTEAINTPLSIVVPSETMRNLQATSDFSAESEPPAEDAEDAKISKEFQEFVRGKNKRSTEDVAEECRRRIYEECLHFLRTAYCDYTVKRLAAEIKSMPDDNPEKKDLLMEMLAQNKRLFELRKSKRAMDRI